MSDREAAIQIEMMDGSSKPYVPLAELAAARALVTDLGDMLTERENKLAAASEREAKLRQALRDLHAEVEMAESVGICLRDRVPSLRAGLLLAALADGEGET